ncbi:MAG: hypothetical protein ACETWM_06755 [Candidatus Lokiarchaeia archaeon]
MNIVLLENSITLSRTGDLIFATIFGHAKSPRKIEKSHKIEDPASMMALEKGYLSLSVGGSDGSKILYEGWLGGVR